MDTTDNASNLDSLLEISSGTDVPLLLKAKEDAKRRVKDDPSAANLTALNRATTMLREAMSQNGEQIFAGAKEVLAWLQAQGRKVSQSQLYKDIKRGYLRRHPSGGFRQRDVEQYGQTLKLVALPEQQSSEMGDLARQELQEKVAKTREQRLNIAFDRRIKEGKYILREDVALELASRASALDVGLRSVFRLHAPDLVRLVGGDAAKTEAMIAEFEKNLDMALMEYSKPMEFKVEYVPEKSEAEPEAAEGEDESDGCDAAAE